MAFLDRVEEVEGVGLGSLENLLNLLIPLDKLVVLVDLGAIFLVEPVHGVAMLVVVVHLLAANLHLNPVALGAHDGHVQGTIAIGLAVDEPVAGALGVSAVELRYHAVDLQAVVVLVAALGALKDDSCCIDVVDLIDGDALALHLLPNRVARLHARLELIDEALLVEALPDGSREALKHAVSLLLRCRDGLRDARVGVGVLILKAQVLKFGFYGI